MEKKFKPVPDVECLKYHGTKEKPDIKIFVSHRIDLDSETIDNPLYIPVRCGAVYDKREGVTMLGDDTGDNISEKRESYCELTVQYWAWKNVKADYYGLCHYRRYLDFSGNNFPVSISEHDNGCIKEEFLSEKAVDKYCLQEETMCKQIESADIIAIEPIMLQGRTNYEAMSNSPDYHNMTDVDLMIDYIELKYPQMIPDVEEYMRHGDKCWLYNCYIMKKEAFCEYNNWLFDVLIAIEKKIDNKHYSVQMCRTIGTLAERLFGIYITHILRTRKYKVKFQKLVFFGNTKKMEVFRPQGSNNIAVVSNFNNNYVSVFSAFLRSALCHCNSKNFYDFIVLSRDITDSNKRLLEEMIKISNASIRFLDTSRYLYGLNMFVDNAVYTDDMYVRVLIPHILSQYDKVLVVDADMICNADIAELYNTTLGEYWAAAVKDVVYAGYLNGMQQGTLEYAEKVLKLSDPYNYCNTGVIILNCKIIRNNYSLEYLQNYISTHQFRIYEQDTLNVLLDGHIYFLNRSWNTFTYTNSFVKDCTQYAPKADCEEYLVARKNPKIIHYAAHPKPWWTGDGDYSTIFWQYARQTPFYEQLLSNMVCFTSNVPNVSASPSQPVNNRPEDNRTMLRKIIDSRYPGGSRTRNLIEKIAPWGSKRRSILKSIYYIFHPSYDPTYRMIHNL